MLGETIRCASKEHGVPKVPLNDRDIKSASCKFALKRPAVSDSLYTSRGTAVVSVALLRADYSPRCPAEDAESVSLVVRGARSSSSTTHIDILLPPFESCFVKTTTASPNSCLHRPPHEAQTRTREWMQASGNSVTRLWCSTAAARVVCCASSAAGGLGASFILA